MAGLLRRCQTACREALISEVIPSWRAMARQDRSPKATAESREMNKNCGRILRGVRENRLTILEKEVI